MIKLFISSHQLILKFYSRRYYIRPYSNLDKEAKDFNKYSIELKMLYITKYFHLAVGIDCKYYKKNINIYLVLNTNLTLQDKYIFNLVHLK